MKNPIFNLYTYSVQFRQRNQELNRFQTILPKKTASHAKTANHKITPAKKSPKSFRHILILHTISRTIS